MSTGTILSPYRRRGLGAKFLEIANVLYKPDIIALRMRSGAAKECLRKSGLTEGPISPFERLFDEDSIMAGVLDLADKKTEHPKPVNKKTGRMEGVYPEGWDRAYKNDTKSKEANDADVQMHEEFDLEPDNGDAIIVAARVSGKLKHIP